jgi:glycerol-3-phosphate dehydrogenase subunit C
MSATKPPSSTSSAPLTEPTQHPRRVPFQDASFYDAKAAMTELRRVFDICNGCRRCFNLCSLFPKLFDLLDDDMVDGDINRLTDDQIASVVPQCTLCDMCYMAKCPYVPPHPFNVDLPRALLRFRAITVRQKAGIGDRWTKWTHKMLAKPDLYAATATGCGAGSCLANAAMGCGPVRKVGQVAIGVDARADMPQFRRKSLDKTFTPPPPNPNGPAYGQETWLYLTCFSNYYEEALAHDAARLLAHWGVKVHSLYPGCCGMPLWEQGLLDQVARKAQQSAKILNALPQVIPLTPSCSFMLRSEWPSLLPDDPDVTSLAKKTIDLSQFILQMVRTHAIKVFKNTDQLPKISIHMACHVRAQNQGNASHQLVETVLDKRIPVIERCSGHGGLWGYLAPHFDTAMQMAKTVLTTTGFAKPAPMEKIADQGDRAFVLLSECPLAARHLAQQAKLLGFKALDILHPISFLAQLITPTQALGPSADGRPADAPAPLQPAYPQSAPLDQIH